MKAHQSKISSIVRYKKPWQSKVARSVQHRKAPQSKASSVPSKRKLTILRFAEGPSTRKLASSVVPRFLGSVYLDTALFLFGTKKAVLGPVMTPWSGSVPAMAPNLAPAHDTGQGVGRETSIRGQGVQ